MTYSQEIHEQMIALYKLNSVSSQFYSDLFTSLSLFKTTFTVLVLRANKIYRTLASVLDC